MTSKRSLSTMRDNQSEKYKILLTSLLCNVSRSTALQFSLVPVLYLKIKYVLTPASPLTRIAISLIMCLQ